MTITVFHSRFATSGGEVDANWQGLSESPRALNLNRSEFAAMSKEDRDAIKDKGGFIAGKCVNRNSVDRSAVVLDADGEDAVALAEIEGAFVAFEWFAWPTAKSAPGARRWRIVVPLVEPILPEAYAAVSREVAGLLGGADAFDPVSFRANQMAFFPVRCDDDQKWVSIHHPGVVYTPTSKVLARALPDPTTKGLGDPTTLPGIMGVFNQAYPTIPDVIRAFNLPYVQSDREDVWSFTGADSRNGLKLYNNLQYAYSFHSTDPVADGHCHHAYGMLEKHRGAAEAAQLAHSDEMVRSLLAASFSQTVQLPLKIEANGTIAATLDNVIALTENHGWLSQTWLDDRSQQAMTSYLPWRVFVGESFWQDGDSVELQRLLERAMGRPTKPLLATQALTQHLQNHRRNPLRDLLTGLEWDGVQRVNHLFVDALCAERSPVALAMTRAWLIGAVKRVFEPGCKNDNMIVLVGHEGIGKSFLIEALGMGYTSTGLRNFEDKDARMLAGQSWLLEIGELTAMRRSDREAVKAFLTETFDDYRPPYGRHSIRVPRQCSFIATTNEQVFLDNEPGNRRFWPIQCAAPRYDASRLAIVKPEYVQQIWAEAVNAYQRGEDNYLPLSSASEIAERALSVTDEDDMLAVVQAYLDEHTEINRVCEHDILVSCLNVYGPAAPFQRKRVRSIMGTISGWHLLAQRQARCDCTRRPSGVWERDSDE